MNKFALFCLQINKIRDMIPLLFAPTDFMPDVCRLTTYLRQWHPRHLNMELPRGTMCLLLLVEWWYRSRQKF